MKIQSQKKRLQAAVCVSVRWDLAFWLARSTLDWSYFFRVFDIVLL